MVAANFSTTGSIIFPSGGMSSTTLTPIAASVHRIINFPDADGVVALTTRTVTGSLVDYPIDAAESGKVFINAGGGAVTFTLPTPVAGLEYTFVVAVAQDLNIDPDAAGIPTIQILVDTDTAGDAISSNTVGTTVTFWESFKYASHKLWDEQQQRMITFSEFYKKYK